MSKIKLLVLLFLIPAIAFAQTTTEEAFSPHQGATALIVRTIGEAQKSVHVAAYSFTSQPIADALAQAHQRGIDVEVVLDKSQSKGRYKLVDFLKENNIPTRINAHYSIMHNKFMIIDGRVLELGSFNYTKAAENKNAENVLVLRDEQQAVAGYIKQWEKLWDESE
jgi:phosphatidylserine/phosphatidylglycerophosphate/cardiolipin synthase-like enzyme